MNGKTQLDIYAGVYDGLTGSVPITHAINFYNRVAKSLGASSSNELVSDTEKLYLLEFRKPQEESGNIGNRQICLTKKYKKPFADDLHRGARNVAWSGLRKSLAAG